ncbi:hypothetical protein SRHO_G00278860 [Serrasalmus rhombeus]
MKCHISIAVKFLYEQISFEVGLRFQPWRAITLLLNSTDAALSCGVELARSTLNAAVLPFKRGGCSISALRIEGAGSTSSFQLAVRHGCSSAEDLSASASFTY